MLNKQEEFDMAATGYAPRAGDPKENPTGPNTAAERLNFNVSPAVASEVRGLARDLDLSMTQLFRYAISILKIAIEESRKKRKLVIADENGTVLRELVLPGLGSR